MTTGGGRLPATRARVAIERRQAWWERHQRAAELMPGRCGELGCNWPGPLLVRDGQVVCPRCGCVDERGSHESEAS